MVISFQYFRQSYPEILTSWEKWGRKVAIQDGADLKTVELEQGGKEFSSAYKKITVKFENDAGSDRDVYFESKEKAQISLPEKWKSWKCGSNEENIRCSMVRNGKFAWEGTYEIDFSGMSYFE